MCLILAPSYTYLKVLLEFNREPFSSKLIESLLRVVVDSLFGQLSRMFDFLEGRANTTTPMRKQTSICLRHMLWWRISPSRESFRSRKWIEDRDQGRCNCYLERAVNLQWSSVPQYLLSCCCLFAAKLRILYTPD